MTDLPKEVTNDWEENPFISLKILLQEPCSISIGALATAIEDNGICKYDEYQRLKAYSKDSEEGVRALGLLKTLMNYNHDQFNFMQNFHDASQNKYINEYIFNNPYPLNDIDNPCYGGDPFELASYPSDYNYYGWLKNDLPVFSSIETNQIGVSNVNKVQEPVAHPIITNEPTHDPLPLSGIALIFKLEQVDIDNTELWRSFAKEAARNGLITARVVIGSGTAQSTFDPVAVGEWLVTKGKMDQAKVARFLNSNLPKRSAHLKDM